MRRALVAIVLAIALAGCSGFEATTATPTPTHAATPTAQSAEQLTFNESGLEATLRSTILVQKVEVMQQPAGYSVIIWTNKTRLTDVAARTAYTVSALERQGHLGFVSVDYADESGPYARMHINQTMIDNHHTGEWNDTEYGRIVVGTLDDADQ